MTDPQPATGSSKPLQRGRFTYTKPTEERPFASSAAKRSSVMALGRIDHLQHYFAREARRVHNASYTGETVELPEEEEEDPPTPIAEPRQQVWQESDRVSWKEMREKVWSEIDTVCQRWGIVDHLREPTRKSQALQEATILDLITLTTTAIRSVQHFVISLPAELGALTFDTPSSTRPSSARQTFVSTASRPRTSLQAQAGSSSMKRDPSNPSNELRTACLDVLGTLKEMDLNYRVTHTQSSEEEDTQNTQSSAESTEAEETEETQAEEVYRDVNLAELTKEKEAVTHWIQVVDRTLFATMRKSGVNDHTDTPEWAKSENFSTPLLQAHQLVVSHLPIELLSQLEAPPLFLDSLANGQLLCMAFNGITRQSSRPWGFIPSSAIHPFSAMTTTNSRRQVSEGSTVGLTFRRLENLQSWLAAIKLRYGVSLRTEEFDLKAVARKDEGWEKMLSLAVERWTVAVVSEKRKELGL